jgi:N-methylhydantoinase B
MVRSSYSSIIYEGYDFSCVLLDGEGRLIAESGEDHPFHIIPVAGAVEGALMVHRSIGPDDLLLHNDPYTGGTHLNDVAVIWPVFGGDAAIFYVVVRSHWGDVGGMSAGSLNGAASEIIQEGLRLNYLKIPRSGTSEVLRLIFDNVRATRDAVSDFQSVLGICRVAERRLCDLVAKYGQATLEEAIETILTASERRLRAAIGKLPSGRYRHVAYLDGNASTPHPLAVAVEITIDGETLSANFTGSSPQVPAPLNAGPAIAPTSVLTVVKSFLDPRGAITSGTLRAIAVSAPPGTIVNARPAAPCGGLNEVRFTCDAAIMGALGRIIPERMTGDVRGTSNHTYIGGPNFIFYEYPSGGTGGSSVADGNTAVRAFNEGENVSIQSAEVVEAIYPLKIRNEIRPDSGGPGEHRGGCGLIREVEIRTDAARLSVLSDRNIVPPAGVNGGASGAPNRYRVRRAGDAIAPSDFPGKIANFPLRKGDVLVMESSGGGGWGPPGRRSAEAIAADLAGGYVTEAGLAHYSRVGTEVDVASDPKLAASHAYIGSVLASSLGIGLGDLVEILQPRGPSLRVWIGEINPELGEARIVVAASLRAAARGKVRPLSSFGRRKTTAHAERGLGNGSGR